MSSEEQDRMGREETVHIKINRRRRSQIWRQWFGLGSLSRHSGAGSGFRIRLGLGFRMDTWSRRMGAFYRERILTPGPVHITPSKPEKHCSEIFNLNWLSNNPNYFFPFCMGPQRHNYWWHCEKAIYFYFSNYKKKKKSKARLKTRRRAGRCRMDPHAKESGK